MNEAKTLDRILDIWTQPGAGLGEIRDILDDLAARRRVAPEIQAIYPSLTQPTKRGDKRPGSFEAFIAKEGRR